MPGELHGEVMDLVWDSWCPDALYVRGHMEPEEATEALEHFYGYDGFRLRDPVKAWARWSCEPGPDGCGQVLRDYNEPGRGRFPVMRAEVIAKHVDSGSWQWRREGTQWCREQKKHIPLMPAGEECDCDHWNGGVCMYPPACACGGKCACHWSPRHGEFWRRTTEEENKES